jgi:hypothetical protein
MQDPDVAWKASSLCAGPKLTESEGRLGLVFKRLAGTLNQTDVSVLANNKCQIWTVSTRLPGVMILEP